MNYQYLMYPGQQMNANYPSLTQANEEQMPATHPAVNDQEELANIITYIKHLKDPEKREEVVPLRHRP